MFAQLMSPMQPNAYQPYPLLVPTSPGSGLGLHAHPPHHLMGPPPPNGGLPPPMGPPPVGGEGGHQMNGHQGGAANQQRSPLGAGVMNGNRPPPAFRMNGITKPDVPTEGPTQLRKLFIGGLTPETTDEMLAEFYSQWGVVVDCIVIRDPHTKHSRGFGFITYAKAVEAETSMNERPHLINGKQVDPKRAIPREDMVSWTATYTLPSWLQPNEGDVRRKVYVSGVNWDYHTVDVMKDYFEKYGPLRQIEILGSPKGVAFVVFQEELAMEECSRQKLHQIVGKRVEVVKAERHNEVPPFEVIKPRGGAPSRAPTGDNSRPPPAQASTQQRGAQGPPYNRQSASPPTGQQQQQQTTAAVSPTGEAKGKAAAASDANKTVSAKKKEKSPPALTTAATGAPPSGGAGKQQSPQRTVTTNVAANKATTGAGGGGGSKTTAKK